jgi:Tfp pilus assembly protein PilX
MNRALISPHQRGATLVMAMIFLIVATVLGVGSMSSSRMQIGMSRNVQQKAVSFQRAENAREAAEARIRQIIAAGSGFPSGQGLYNDTAVTPPAVTDKAFWQTAANFVAVDGGGGYAIEYLGRKSITLDDRTTTAQVNVYRLNAYGKGGDGVTETLSQSIFLGD